MENKKEILQKEKQIKQHALLLDKVEKQIKNKKNVFEELLNNLPETITTENKKQTKETLDEIKCIVGYLKLSLNKSFNSSFVIFCFCSERRIRLVFRFK